MRPCFMPAGALPVATVCGASFHQIFLDNPQEWLEHDPRVLEVVARLAQVDRNQHLRPLCFKVLLSAAISLPLDRVGVIAEKKYHCSASKKMARTPN